jgi:RHS repeat-associated protein
MPQRSMSSGSYRYGFNGKENDNDVKGTGNQLNFGARIYDSRLGRYLSIDPLYAKHADMQPYHHASNNPVNRIDPDGNDDIHFHYLTKTVFLPDGAGGTRAHTKIFSWASVVRNNLPNTFAVHHHSININQNGDRSSTYTERVIPFYPEAKWPSTKSGVTTSTFLGITRPDNDYTSLLKKLEEFPEISTKYPSEIRNPEAANSQRDRNADFMWDALKHSKARTIRVHEQEQVNRLMLGVISTAAGEFLIGKLLFGGAGNSVLNVSNRAAKRDFQGIKGVYIHEFKSGTVYVGQTKDLGYRPLQSLDELLNPLKKGTAVGDTYSKSTFIKLEGSGFNSLNELENSVLNSFGGTMRQGGNTYNIRRIPAGGN